MQENDRRYFTGEANIFLIQIALSERKSGSASKIKETKGRIDSTKKRRLFLKRVFASKAFIELIIVHAAAFLDE